MSPTADTEHVEKTFNGSESLPGTLSGHTFEDCIFENCDFKDIVLAKARFVGCSFLSCDLSNVALSGSQLRSASFESCKLLGIQWTRLDDFVTPSFKESNLSYGNLVGLKLKKTCLLYTSPSPRD